MHAVQASAGQSAPDPATYTVAVRLLCEFSAKQGDLDLRFTTAPTAQQGMAGHQTLAARRGPGYQAELPLAGRYRHLLVRGRADGYDPVAQRLDEVKTFHGDLRRDPTLLPDNHRALHWAQAKVYGALICQQLGLAELSVALVYFDIVSQQAAPPLTLNCQATELQAFFEALCERFLQWADDELLHRARRDQALADLPFPHGEFRPGQRRLAEAVYRGARAGRSLMAQAPTGIGKTLGTLFPLLKACPTQRLDKLVFLTAKGSGRGTALTAIDSLRRANASLPLRVLDLSARDKACEHPDKACHGDSCPLAKGFFDRLPAARATAVRAAEQRTLTQPAVREIALAHQVCPYHLGQELTRWCDVLVGDYNHWFDGHALVYSLAQADGWRVAVLVDEAHNLLERARQMHSAELDSQALRALRAVAPTELKKPLDKLRRRWTSCVQSQSASYAAYDEAPAAFTAALQEVVTAIGAYLAELPTGRPAEPLGGRLMTLYFEALRFCRLLESFGSHSMFDVTVQAAPDSLVKSTSILCLRNVLPAPFLRPRFDAAHCTVLFSATLTPQAFYADTLGLPPDVAWLDVDAPFRAEQLQVKVVDTVSTRYAHRRGSLAPIADLIAAQYLRQPGHYLAFFSSFDYLQQAATELQKRHPQVPRWQQQRRMDPAERVAFLERFVPGGRGVAFAVLGGLFAEGIDLTGDRLIGAFIATLGLPQLNPLNEELRRRQQIAFGAGYDYTYLYPGLRKVVQAAGRVIRSLTDQGSLHLIDDRYALPEVLRLLPDWWQVEVGAPTSARPLKAAAVREAGSPARVVVPAHPR